MARKKRWLRSWASIGAVIWLGLFAAYIWALYQYGLFFIPKDWTWTARSGSGYTLQSLRGSLSLILGLLLSIYTMAMYFERRKRLKGKGCNPPPLVRVQLVPKFPFGVRYRAETIHTWHPIVVIVLGATVALRPAAWIFESLTGWIFRDLGAGGLFFWIGLVYIGFWIQRIWVLQKWKEAGGKLPPDPVLKK